MPDEKERKIAMMAVRSGEPIPDRILNAPELQAGLQLFLFAFFDLDAERNSSMALGPIPWTAIIQYARAYELDEEQTEDLVYLIKKMDNAHIAKQNNKNGDAS